MSNKDKHTPLSAEELFKLLEDKHEGALSEEPGLDEFEQDALDGFSAHLPVEDARRLTEELNAKISAAVQEKGTQKKKIIWFSSAASVALLIVVSVVFFYQSKDAGTQPIALHVADKNELNSFSPGAAAMEEAPAVVSKSVAEDAMVAPKARSSKASDVSLAEEKNKMAADQQIVLREEEQLEQDIAGMLEKQDKDAVGNGMATSGKVAVTEENSKYKKEEVTFDIAATQTPAETKVQESVLPSTSVALKKSARKAEVTTDDAKQNLQADYDMEMRWGNVSDKVAPYYTGGQHTLKTYIATYIKEKKYPTPLSAATYSVKVIVLTTGKVTVKALTVNKEEAQNTLAGIIEALESMTNWIPLKVNKIPTNSDLSFDLTF